MGAHLHHTASPSTNEHLLNDTTSELDEARFRNCNISVPGHPAVSPELPLLLDLCIYALCLRTEQKKNLSSRDESQQQWTRRGRFIKMTLFSCILGGKRQFSPPPLLHDSTSIFIRLLFCHNYSGGAA